LVGAEVNTRLPESIGEASQNFLAPVGGVNAAVKPSSASKTINILNPASTCGPATDKKSHEKATAGHEPDKTTEETAAPELATSSLMNTSRDGTGMCTLGLPPHQCNRNLHLDALDARTPHHNGLNFCCEGVEKLLDTASTPNSLHMTVSPPVHDSELYTMNHLQRGKAVIFNQENFVTHLANLSTRQGSSKDRDDLAETLRLLDFEVQCFNDLTGSQILNEIEALAAEDHSNRDCVLVAILTHGDATRLAARDVRMLLITFSGRLFAQDFISASLTTRDN